MRPQAFGEKAVDNPDFRFAGIGNDVAVIEAKDIGKAVSHAAYVAINDLRLNGVLDAMPEDRGLVSAAQGRRPDLQRAFKIMAIDRILRGNGYAAHHMLLLGVEGVAHGNLGAEGPAMIHQREREPGMHIGTSYHVSGPKGGL